MQFGEKAYFSQYIQLHAFWELTRCQIDKLKYWNSMFLFIYLFLILLCSPRLHLFDQKHSTNSNIVKNYCNLK